MPISCSTFDFTILTGYGGLPDCFRASTPDWIWTSQKSGSIFPVLQLQRPAKYYHGSLDHQEFESLAPWINIYQMVPPTWWPQWFVWRYLVSRKIQQKLSWNSTLCSRQVLAWMIWLITTPPHQPQSTFWCITVDISYLYSSLSILMVLKVKIIILSLPPKLMEF